jgi:hypothetical protein
MLLVFKKNSQSTTESIVQALSGPMVHVDMVPDTADPYAYTSYMFECFSKNPTLNAYTPDTHTAISLPMTNEERARSVLYLERCVEQSVPYNYPDLVACVTPAASWLVSEVPADNPKTLFCSQAAVLCIRQAVDPTSVLGQAVAKVHSRVTSPSALYAWAKVLGHEVVVRPDMFLVDRPCLVKEGGGTVDLTPDKEGRGGGGGGGGDDTTTADGKK